MEEEKKNFEGALLVGENDAASEGENIGFDDDWDDDEGDDSTYAGDGKAEEAMEFLSGLLYRMGLETRVSVRKDGRKIVLDVTGEDAGRAIGKKGQTLDALQFITNKVMSRSADRKRYVIVDSGDYRERHDEQLMAIAKREAKRAIETGRAITLEPMPARDRRIVHLSLAKFQGVATKSNGEGVGRRIQIIPAGAKASVERNDRPGGGRRDDRRGPRRDNRGGSDRGSSDNRGGNVGERSERSASVAPIDNNDGPIFIGEGTLGDD